MLKNIILITVMLSMILATGCVSKAQTEADLRQQENLAAELARANIEIQAQQQTIAELTGSNNQLQSEIGALKAQLELEKNKNGELANKAQQSQESLKSYRDKVAGIYKTMETNYNNFVARHASSATTTNLMTGEPIPSSDPVLSSTDTELLAIWRTALLRINELIAD